MAAILTDDIFKCIFLNENVWISINISLKFVPKGQINNVPALVQMDLARIVEDTGRRRFRQQTDGRADSRTKGQTTACRRCCSYTFD